MPIDSQLKAIADPTRREILRLTTARELSAGEISKAFSMARPSVSRHIHVLLDAGLLTTRPEGTSRYYQANGAALTDLRRWFEEFWDAGLPRLKALAEEEASRGPNA